MNNVIRVFIGYDPREAVAFNVLTHSIQARASQPVSIVPLMLTQLASVFQRKRDPLQSTDFAFTRFLVPYLSGYKGWSVFMDCDMLMLDDIASLWALRDNKYAVMCVKHNHAPTEEVKFLGAKQTRYQRKNWSSVMLMNNAECFRLTPAYVGEMPGLDLHQFRWLSDDRQIGALPQRWNYLVGYTPPMHDVALVHYTKGGPYFDEYKSCEFSYQWFQERDMMLHSSRGKK